MTRWPSRTRAFGSAAETSARPPVLTNGAISGVTNATWRMSATALLPRRAQASTRSGHGVGGRVHAGVMLPAACPADSASTSSARASVERLLRVIAPAPRRRVPRDRPGRGRAHAAPRRALRARRGGRARRARSPAALRARAPANVEIVAGRRARRRPRGARARGQPPRRQPALLRLEPAAAADPRPARPRPRRRTSCSRTRSRAASPRRPARRSTASSRCSTRSGPTSTSPLRFPPGRLRPAAEGRLGPAARALSCERRGPTSPTSQAFERLRPDSLRPPSEDP